MKKTGPIHRICPDKGSVIAYTWCGVNPYKRRVQVVNDKGVPIRVYDATARKCEKCEKARLDDATARALAEAESDR